MNKRNLIILRGVSGSGKSTFCSLINDAVICCADDFFIDQATGEYKWYPEGIVKAHKYCYDKFVDALINTDKNIIIANTNTKESDWKKYEEKAREHGITVTFVVLENRHGGKDVHNVPEETLARQEQNLRNNLKLR